MEWISVKDRFPENPGYVLCIYKKHLPFVAMYAYRCFSVDGLKETATHWQPLPEAPKN